MKSSWNGIGRTVGRKFSGIYSSLFVYFYVQVNILYLLGSADSLKNIYITSCRVGGHGYAAFHGMALGLTLKIP